MLILQHYSETFLCPSVKQPVTSPNHPILHRYRKTLPTCPPPFRTLELSPAVPGTGVKYGPAPSLRIPGRSLGLPVSLTSQRSRPARNPDVRNRPQPPAPDKPDTAPVIAHENASTIPAFNKHPSAGCRNPLHLADHHFSRRTVQRPVGLVGQVYYRKRTPEKE